MANSTAPTGCRAYSALWPITISDAPIEQLVDEALADLIEMVDAEQLAAAAPVTWHRTEGHLAAVVPVDRVDGTDLRPWESRAAYADDVFDWRAA